MSTYDMGESRKQALFQSLRDLKTKELDARYEIRLFVLAARKENVTWKEIAQALGVSTQACWETYRPKDPPKVKPGV